MVEGDDDGTLLDVLLGEGSSLEEESSAPLVDDSALLVESNPLLVEDEAGDVVTVDDGNGWLRLLCVGAGAVFVVANEGILAANN